VRGGVGLPLQHRTVGRRPGPRPGQFPSVLSHTLSHSAIQCIAQHLTPAARTVQEQRHRRARARPGAGCRPDPPIRDGILNLVALLPSYRRVYGGIRRGVFFLTAGARPGGLLRPRLQRAGLRPRAVRARR
jgi:hypothetical protein